jgi:serine/threonine-protein kinase HipA
VFLPGTTVPTTHILKPAMADYEASAQNEFLCLSIADRLRMPAVKAEIRRAEDQTYVLVERYDRRRLDGNLIERVHQEDFCQALGIVTARKYEIEGGPGFSECFSLLKESDKPALDRTALARFLILNYLLGNADAHGKNFSLLHRPPTSTKIAPLYDVLAMTDIYGVDQRMAMSIGGNFDAASVTQDNWKAFCKKIGYGFPAFKLLLQDQVNEIEQVAARERDKLQEGEFKTWVADSIIYELGRSCGRVRTQFGWK